jgi:hypothetical protein
MILYCPNCGMQHIDAPDPAPQFASPDDVWTNPPHKSHLCHDCGCIWRPADVATNGVAELKTTGKDDTWPAIHNDEVRAMLLQHLSEHDRNVMGVALYHLERDDRAAGSTRDRAKALRAALNAAPGETSCPHGVPHRWPCEQCDTSGVKGHGDAQG